MYILLFQSNFRQFMDYVKHGNVSKVNKMTTKGLDPNFHDSNGGIYIMLIILKGDRYNLFINYLLNLLISGGILSSKE